MSCPFVHPNGNTGSGAAPSLPSGSSHGEEADQAHLVPIPQPPTRWLTGNLSEFNPAFPAKAIWRLASIYGDIYQMDTVTEKFVVISSNELAQEVLDQDRFDKVIVGNMEEVRGLLGDGLFTAHPGEKVTSSVSMIYHLRLYLTSTGAFRAGALPTGS